MFIQPIQKTAMGTEPDLLIPYELTPQPKDKVAIVWKPHLPFSRCRRSPLSFQTSPVRADDSRWGHREGRTGRRGNSGLTLEKDVTAGQTTVNGIWVKLCKIVEN